MSGPRPTPPRPALGLHSNLLHRFHQGCSGHADQDDGPRAWAPQGVLGWGNSSNQSSRPGHPPTLFTLPASLQIRVNAVNPTVVMTPMGRTNWSDPHKAKVMLDRIPLGKFAGKSGGSPD